MKDSIPVSISFFKEELSILDTMRGEVSRSGFIRSLVTGAWKKQDYEQPTQEHLMEQQLFG